MITAGRRRTDRAARMGWMRVAAAAGAGILTAAAFARQETWAAAAAAVAVSLLWMGDLFFPRRARGGVNRVLMVLSTILLAWAAMTGAFRWWLVAAAGLDLACWSAGELLSRWGPFPPPRSAWIFFAKALVIALGIGTIAGASAALFAGHVFLGFAAAFLLLLVAGASTLGVLSRSTRSPGAGKDVEP
jgi:hypothetical protein